MDPEKIFSKQWTPEDLRKMRSQSLLDIKQQGHDSFTCDECQFKFRCIFVYSAYNTMGDCLAEQ